MTAYEEGQQAFYDECAPFDNPYRKDTAAWEEWSKGYLHADMQESGDMGDIFCP